MASLFDNNGNFSLYTIPAAWFLSFAPHVYAVHLYQRASSRQLDNRQPRRLIKMVDDDPSIDSTTKGRILRADGAQQNGFENVGLFATAVVAANMARLDNGWLNILSAGYVLSRLVYNLIYINNTTSSLAMMRSTVFMAGTGIIMKLYIMAANNLWSAGPNL